MASTPARDLPLLNGELIDLLTGCVCRGTDDGTDDSTDDGADGGSDDGADGGSGDGLAAFPHWSQ
ncbi:hypothetical protein AB0M50_10200 [Nonomuraea fuscirosea]|uniref:hypothetical protein n=1 Tax=Nonomuraea fuscirosea TaxID=1291556 RepID=UPI0034255A4A